MLVTTTKLLKKLHEKSYIAASNSLTKAEAHNEDRLNGIHEDLDRGIARFQSLKEKAVEQFADRNLYLQQQREELSKHK